MSDQAIQLSALMAIRDKADADLRRVQKAFDKMKVQVETAEMKLRLLDDTIKQLTQTQAQPQSQRDQVLRIINKSGEAGLTAQEILQEMQSAGTVIGATNPVASVQVAAKRLSDEGVIESLDSERGKVYRKRKPETGRGQPEEEI